MDFTLSSIFNDIATFSTIDHFASTTNVYDVIVEAGVIHSGENLSNHAAIYAKINLGNIEVKTEALPNTRKISWDKSSSDAKINYKKTLEDILDNIVVPEAIGCSDPYCSIHLEEMENYALDVLSGIESAAKACLPSVGGPQKSHRKDFLPGCNDHVRPLADDSKFWHSV